jgi:hypothetical protein
LSLLAAAAVVEAGGVVLVEVAGGDVVEVAGGDVVVVAGGVVVEVAGGDVVVVAGGVVVEVAGGDVVLVAGVDVVVVAGVDVVVVVDPVEALLDVDPVSAAVVTAADVLLVVVASADEPESSDPPQPASAIPTLPSTANRTIRPVPNPRLANPIQTPERRLSMPAGRDEVIEQELHESAAQHGVTGRSHEAMRLPRQLRCHRLFVPLDRWFCVPAFRRVCPWVVAGQCQRHLRHIAGGVPAALKP